MQVLRAFVNTLVTAFKTRNINAHLNVFHVRPRQVEDDTRGAVLPASLTGQNAQSRFSPEPTSQGIGKAWG